MANYASETEIYSWRVVTLDGAPVPASNGLSLTPTVSLDRRRPARPAHGLRRHRCAPFGGGGAGGRAAPPRPARHRARCAVHRQLRAGRCRAAGFLSLRHPLGESAGDPRGVPRDRLRRGRLCHRPRPPDLHRRGGAAGDDAGADHRAGRQGAGRQGVRAVHPGPRGPRARRPARGPPAAPARRSDACPRGAADGRGDRAAPGHRRCWPSGSTSRRGNWSGCSAAISAPARPPISSGCGWSGPANCCASRRCRSPMSGWPAASSRPRISPPPMPAASAARRARNAAPPDPAAA